MRKFKIAEKMSFQKNDKLSSAVSLAMLNDGILFQEMPWQA